MIIVTTATIQGREISQNLGLVKGNTIRAKHIGKDIIAGLRTIVGGEIKEYTNMMQESREQAIQRMVEEAQALGAEAIVEVRFTTSLVMAGASEFFSLWDSSKT